MMLALAAVALASTDVTFEHKAAPAPVVVKALSEAVGERLQADGSLKLDYIVVRFDKTPLDVVKQRLAETLAANWYDTSEGPTLGRSPSQLAKLKADAAKAMASRVREAIAKHASKAPTAAQLRAAVKQVGTLSQDPGGWEKIRKLDQLSPTNRLVVKLMAGIDWEKAVDIESSHQLEFSLRPTKVQLPLGRNALQAIAEHNSEAEIHQLIVKEELGDTSMYWGSLARSSSSIGPNDVVGLYSMVMGSRVFAEVLGLEHTDFMSLSLTEDVAAKPVEGLEGEIEFSEESKAYLAARAAQRTNSGSGSVMERLFEMPDVEPLAWVPSDALLGVARSQGKDLVAVVPDWSLLVAELLADSKDGLGKLLARAGRVVPQRVVTEPYISISPENPLEDHVWRIDRAALGRYLRAVAVRAPTLDDLADLATHLRGRYDLNLAAGLVSLATSDPQLSDMYMNRELLAAYGQLSSTQRTKAREPGGLAVNLPLAVGQIPKRFFDLVFRSRARLEFKSDPKEQHSLWDLDPFERTMVGGNEWLTRSPTVVLGNGLPAGSRLVFEVKKVSRIAANWQLGSWQAQRPQTPQALGNSMVSTQMFESDVPLPNRFALVEAEQLTITGVFGDVGKATWVAEYGGRADPKKMTPLSELPEDVRKTIEAAMAKAKEMYGGIQDQQTVPPAP